LSGLNLETTPAQNDKLTKSPIDEALEKGKAMVGNQERKVVKAKRTTNEGKKS